MGSLKLWLSAASNGMKQQGVLQLPLDGMLVHPRVAPPPPQGLCTHLYTGRRETINVTSMEINKKTNDCYLLLLGELISVSKIKKKEEEEIENQF